MALPSDIEQFLRESERCYSAADKPAWLRNSPCDHVWHISIPQRGLERTLSLRWEFLLPSGCLADKRWSVALEQAKSLTFAHGSSPFSRGNVAMIPWFQSTLLSLIEYAAYTAPTLLEREGIRFFGEDDINDYLHVFKRAGVSGAGFWQARWEAFLKRSIADPANARLIDSWRSTASKDLILSIRHRTEELQRVMGGSSELLKPQFLQEDETEQAVYLLHAKGFLEPDGCLSRIAVANAINVNNRRVVASKMFHAILRTYETCTDYRSRDSRRSTCEEAPNQRCRGALESYVAGSSGSSRKRTFGSIRSAIIASNRLPELYNSPFACADLDSIPISLRGGAGGRTPTLPLDTALYIYDHMVAWAVNIGPHLLTYVLKLLGVVREKSDGLVPKPKRAHGPTILQPNLGCQWEAAFQAYAPPPQLSSLRLRGYAAQIRYRGRIQRRSDGTNGILADVRQHGLTVEDALLLHCAVLVGLTAAFSLRRRSEIYALDHNCLSETKGGSYLDFGLAKNGCEDQRPRLRRPIPRLLHTQLRQWIHLQSVVRNCCVTGQEEGSTRLFEGIPELGPRLNNSYISLGLSALCDWIEVPYDRQGRRWYIRCHECRRFGAMSFFRHSGYEASLPALAWMLGHRDISETWTYIKEELAGAELSAVEVALAHDAVLAGNHAGFSDDRDHLVSVLETHFGTSNLCSVSCPDLLEYLAELRERGEFSITPHTLRDRNGTRYVVLIHCRRISYG